MSFQSGIIQTNYQNILCYMTYLYISHCINTWNGFTTIKVTILKTYHHCYILRKARCSIKIIIFHTD